MADHFSCDEDSRMPLRILPVHAGGTIASVSSGDGFRPGLSFDDIVARLEMMPEGAGTPAVFLKTLAPFGPHGIDSSLMTTRHMVRLARDIAARLDACDAVLVTHGTDTLAHTSAMLAIMLAEVTRPIVLTGAQKPLEEAGSDAPGNLRDALRVVAHGIPGVRVVFGGRVLAGSRASKVDSTSLQAFESINVPGCTVESFCRMPRAGAGSPLAPSYLMDASDGVEVLHVHPGFQSERFRAFLSDETLRGVVVQVYGLGGMPPGLTGLLTRWIRERNGFVVARSQCLRGMTDLGKYAVGREAQQGGVISARDMSLEAAYAKTAWVLAHFDGHEERCRQFYIPRGGEIQGRPGRTEAL